MSFESSPDASDEMHNLLKYADFPDYPDFGLFTFEDELEDFDYAAVEYQAAEDQAIENPSQSDGQAPVADMRSATVVSRQK